jgi:hypothetical protein
MGFRQKRSRKTGELKWQLTEVDIDQGEALPLASTSNPQSELAAEVVVRDRAAQQVSAKLTAHTSPTNRTPDIAGRSFTTTDLSNQSSSGTKWP